MYCADAASKHNTEAGTMNKRRVFLDTDQCNFYDMFSLQ